MSNVITREITREITRKVFRRTPRRTIGDDLPDENYLGTEDGFTFLLETGDKFLIEETI